MDKGTFDFRIDTNQFLNEIADCAIPQSMGVLKIPLNIFKSLLAQTAQRATEINDPQLNILMLKLGLYEVSPFDIPAAIENQEKLIK